MSGVRKLSKVSLHALMLKTTLRIDAQPQQPIFCVYLGHFLSPPTARQKITFEFLAQNVEVSFPTNGPVDIFHVFEQVTFVSVRCCMFEKIILLFVSIVIEFGARLSKFYLLEEG